MTNKTTLAIVLGLSFAANARGQEPPKSPQQLIELSRQATDLVPLGPYQLRATVVLNPRTAKELKGQITVLRKGELYKSELQLAQYREARWVSGNKLYVARSQTVPVPKMLLMRSLDRLWRPGLLPPEAKTSKISTDTRNHKEVECFDVKDQESQKQKFCFDPATSALVMVGGFEFHQVEFLDYSAFEKKYFPTHIVFREPVKGVVLELKDITITKADPVAEAFAPPAGVPAFDTCDERTPPYKVKDAIPDIPKDELRQLRDTQVYLYWVIGADGTVQNLTVEYAAHASFAKSATDAIRQWRYSPARCGDKAVPMEAETMVRYFMP
ncbi:MAG TPA: energy transducer TonB [Candidatus Angelobacter sp.]